MASSEHLAKLKEGVEAWNQWCEQNPQVKPDLSRAELDAVDLTQANLKGVDFSGAKLSGAKLSGANLSGADLSDSFLYNGILNHANLHKAKLSGAELYYAALAAANLSGANLSGAKLHGVDLTQADLSRADLSGADLSYATLVRSNFEAANLTACRVYGISAWDVRLEGANQSKLVITPGDESPIQVDNLEVAQFIYLLLSRQKLRNVITTIGEKAVLILGRFTERKELLDRMADKLRSLGYIPMIFDFDRPTDRDLTETVKILAGLSRFVIADITNPRSVPLELEAAVPDYMVPFVTILQRGQPAFGMFDDLPRKYHWALPLLEYNTADTLLAAFDDKILAPALEKADQVRQQKAAPPLRRSAEE